MNLGRNKKLWSEETLGSQRELEKTPPGKTWRERREQRSERKEGIWVERGLML